MLAWEAAERGRRSLERRFLRAMGVGPKKFARVVRLQGALAEPPQPEPDPAPPQPAPAAA